MATVNLSSIITPANVLTASGTATLTNKTINIASNTLTGVQPTLVSGTSIKTVNSTSLLGSGDIAVGGLAAATQAEMEAATSNTVAATPANTKYSPVASKAWIKINVTGGTPTNSISYNVASIADTATGKCTVTLTTGFSSSNYVVLCSVDSGGTVTSTPDVRITSGTVFFAEITNTSNVPIDPREYFFATFGDQS